MVEFLVCIILFSSNQVTTKIFEAQKMNYGSCSAIYIYIRIFDFFTYPSVIVQDADRLLIC